MGGEERNREKEKRKDVYCFFFFPKKGSQIILTKTKRLGCNSFVNFGVDIKCLLKWETSATIRIVSSRMQLSGPKVAQQKEQFPHSID